MSLRVLIADDEPLARDVLRLMLSKREDVVITGECRNGREAVAAILAAAPDLVFLDVQMPDLDGFGVIETVGAERMPAVVFVTAYDRYALRAFEAHALDYLLKPFERERLETTLERAMARMTGGAELVQRLQTMLAARGGNGRAQAYLSKVPIKGRDGIAVVDVEAVEWIEAAGDYVKLHTGAGQHLVHQTLTGFIAQLDPARFRRVHRSAAVNVDRIRKLYPHFNGEFFLELEGGARVKLSRSYRDNIQDLFGSLL